MKNNLKMYKKIILSCLAVLSFMAFVGNAHAITLSQSNVSLTVGQSISVPVNYVSGYLSLSSNTNSNIATVSINGSNLNIYGVMAGSTTATVCDSISGCGTLYITVNGNGTSGTLSLSQTYLSLSVGQTSTVTAYNAYGNYGTLYVSSNSNQYVATTSVIGNTVSIYGSTSGSTNIIICQSYNVCGTVYVTVSGNGYNNGAGSGLNLSNVTLSIGSSITISPSNNYNYSYYNNTNGLYVSSNSNPLVASAVSSSSSIIPGCYGNNLYSVTTGQPCTPILYNNYNNTSYIPGCYGTNLYSVTTGQPCNGSSVGGSGSIVITALSAGIDAITLCQNGSTCNSINVLVNG